MRVVIQVEFADDGIAPLASRELQLDVESVNVSLLA